MIRRRTPAFALALALLVLAAPTLAFAQDEVALNVEVGLDGYVSTDAPTTVTVTMAADQLIVGTLEVTRDSLTLVSEIEVPAGTTKAYELELPPPASSNSNVITVVVRDQDDEALGSTRFSTRSAIGEALVGVFGDSALLQAIETMTTTPFETRITTLSLSETMLTSPLDTLDYLLLAQPVSEPAAETIRNWVSSGGRLTGTVEALDSVGLTAPLGQPLVVGQGIVESHDLTVTDGAVDGLIITSVPVTLPIFDGGFNEIGSTLFEAASFSQRAEFGFGWLALALVIYVAIVGPLNFLVLHRLGKRELAWITVPALGVVGMLVFASLGSSASQTTRVRHATVVISDRGVTTAESGVLLVASTEGTHELSVRDAQLTPFDAARWFGTGQVSNSQVRIDDDGQQTASFELASLGLGSVNAHWEPAAPAVVVGATTVENASSLTFSHWGVRTQSEVHVGREPLEPNESIEFEAMSSSARFNGFEGTPIAEAVFSASAAFNFEDEQQIWPLSWAASQIEPELLAGGTYFFGFTDDLEVNVTSNGDSHTAEGNTLVIVAIDGAQAVEQGEAAAQLLAAPGAEHIERWGPTFVYGADEVALRFVVPADVTELTLTSSEFPGLAGAQAVQVYNFDNATFTDIDLHDSFSPAGHLSPLGEVMIRVEYGEFEFAEVWVEAIKLEWGDT